MTPYWFTEKRDVLCRPPSSDCLFAFLLSLLLAPGSWLLLSAFQTTFITTSVTSSLKLFEAE
jgi:hypothetical protein